jgi:beta-glucosidase
MKKLLFIQLVLIILIAEFNSCDRQKTNINGGFDHKADSILNLMTLDEKTGQLCLFTADWDITGPVMKADYKKLIKEGKAGGIFNAFTVDFIMELQRIAVEESRLGIPLIFGYDVVHGHRTIFPIPLAQSSSWDTSAIRQSDRIAATEASAEGINWTFAPVVDLTRDPRWGRVAESAGEDPWLGSVIARSRIKGFQADNLKLPNTLLTCAKHFAAYGAPQAGRDYHTVDMSERSLHEWYLLPFEASVDAEVGSIMTSFNEIAGVPSTSNHWLLTDLLRNTWNFNGFVVTDYKSIQELIPHGVASDLAEAAELAIKAGVDMDMQSGAYLNNMAALVKSGKIDEKLLNDAVKRILIAKLKLGLFDDPYLYCNKDREQSEIMKPEYLNFAREFAANSCVLLKNKNNTLPIPEHVKSIALMGPLGNSKVDMLGSWSAAGQSDKCVTLYEGLKNNLPPTVKITYVKGCDINSFDRSDFSRALEEAKKSDFIILALGESRNMTGEASSRTSIRLPGVQSELALSVLKTGIPAAVVLFNGRPLVIPEIDSIAPAIVEAWFGGTQAGNGIADILTGKINPSGKLTLTFPLNEGQIPIFYSTKSTGRPIDPEDPHYKYTSRYIDAPNTPLYPFGYGLSYTTFKYSAITLNKKIFQKGELIIASVDVINTGKYNGSEVVQLYIRDIIGEVTRPVKELKGFSKICLGKNQTTKVTFVLSPDELSYYHLDMHFGWDPGEFELFIGRNSADTNSITFRME